MWVLQFSEIAEKTGAFGSSTANHLCPITLVRKRHFNKSLKEGKVTLPAKHKSGQ